MQSQHGMTEFVPLIADSQHGSNGVGINVGQEDFVGSSLKGARHYFSSIFVELFGIEVAMGVDKHYLRCTLR